MLTFRFVLLAAMVTAGGGAASAEEIDLARLSIEELSRIEITSVSRRPERLDEAAAAVYVLRNEDIRRSGVQSLPETLRLAPNLHVARIDALDYAISARGQNGFESANKLLVQIDGRSVYSPLYSGVEWDQHLVMLDDVARIEVVSGPGGTLYGANAVNGVVNVISRPAGETQGLLVNVVGGTVDSSASARWGGAVGDSGFYRVYAMGYERGDLLTASGDEADDGWSGAQAGFRGDWGGERNRYTLQGDIYDNDVDAVAGLAGFEQGAVSGHNLLGRWERRFGAEDVLTLQAYYDVYERTARGLFDSVETVDVQAQHAFTRGRHQLLVGAEYRTWRDQFRNFVNAFTLDPPSRRLSLGSVFAQDSIALRENLTLTVGIKAEESSYTGLEYMPNARLAWRASDTALLWGAVSRVARNPSRLERDLVAPPFLVRGNFQPEQLIAYEVGYRGRPMDRLSVSATIYLHDFDDVRSNESTPVTFIPLTVGNGVEGTTTGLEAWADYDISERWRLSAGLSALSKDFKVSAGSRDVSALEAQGVDPNFQASLRSQTNLRDDIDLDIRLRYVADVPRGAANGYVGADAYFEADARLGWRLTDRVELSLAGLNLLDESHPEASETRRKEPRRRLLAGLRLAW
jgi:iron complex outermembrane receptor protein